MLAALHELFSLIFMIILEVAIVSFVGDEIEVQRG